MIGEWGNRGPGRGPADTWVEGFLQWADKHQYSWAAWSFMQGSATGDHWITQPPNYTPTPYMGVHIQNYLYDRSGWAGLPYLLAVENGIAIYYPQSDNACGGGEKWLSDSSGSTWFYILPGQ